MKLQRYEIQAIERYTPDQFYWMLLVYDKQEETHRTIAVTGNDIWEALLSGETYFRIEEWKEQFVEIPSNEE